MEELQTVLRCDTSLPQPLAIKSKWCPLLQDIDGDIAHILSLSEGQSSEVTMTKSSYADLREARSVAFMYAIGIVLDSDDTDTIELPKYKLKQRRGVKGGLSLALDLVKLFNFICGYDIEFPISVLSKNGPISFLLSTAVSVVVNASSPTRHQNEGHSPRTPDHVTGPINDMPDNSLSSNSLLDSLSQDLPCAQQYRASVSSPASPPQGTTGPSVRQMSPWLLDSPNSLSHSASNYTACISMSSLSNHLGNSPDKPSPSHPPCCCDHGRAIIDLRCTVDVMQLELNKFQRQIKEYSATQPSGDAIPSVQAGALAQPDCTHAAVLALPSPPNSHPPSPVLNSDISQSAGSSSCLSMDSFSDIFGLHVPGKSMDNDNDITGPHTERLNGAQPDQPSVAVRNGTIGAAPSGGCDGSMPDPSGNDREIIISANVEYMRDEMDSLRTQIQDFDDRLIAVEMSDVTQKGSLEAIINQSKDSKKVTQSQITDIKQRVSKNNKRIKKLSQKTKKPHKKSNGSESIANIECRNRFAVLQNSPQSSYVRTNNSTNDPAVSTTKKQKSAHRHRTEHRKTKPKPVSVKIIGASMVRGQGRLLNDTKQGVSACCYPNPGFTAEQIRDRLPGMISKHDDIVVLLGGTNNVTRDTVATCITEINSLIEDTKILNKRAHIIVCEIPLRFDDISLN